MVDDEPAALSVPTNVVEAPDDADWCAASDKKNAATAAMAEGKLEEALALFSDALEAEAATASLSATTLAKRAECLMKLKRPKAAVSDCTAALEINPDSCRAYKVRGKGRRDLSEWTGANLDLAAAQNIDFDPELAPLCEEVKEKAAAAFAENREAEREKELNKRRAAARAKRQAE